MTAAIRQVLCEPAQAASMVTRAAALAPTCCGRRSPPATAHSPTTSSTPTRRRRRREHARRSPSSTCSGSPTTSASSSTPRDVDAPAAPRLLPRRRRPGAGRRGPPTRPDAVRSATSLDATSTSSSALRPPTGAATTASASTDAGRTRPASTTAGDGRCGASGPRPPAPATTPSAGAAAEAFALSARWRSGHRRAMTFAALGAAEVLTVAPDDGAAQGAARRRRPVHRTPDRQPRRGRGPKHA